MFRATVVMCKYLIAEVARVSFTFVGGFGVSSETVVMGKFLIAEVARVSFTLVGGFGVSSETAWS